MIGRPAIVNSGLGISSESGRKRVPASQVLLFLSAWNERRLGETYPFGVHRLILRLSALFWNWVSNGYIR